MALTQEQQNRLNELQKQKAQILLQQQQQQTADAQLIQDLAGQRPSAPLRPAVAGREAFRAGTVPFADPPSIRLEELKRRRADLLLQQQGKSPQQIQFMLDVNRRTKPPAFGRTAGGITGALAVPAAINLIPGFAALPEEIVTIPMALLKTAKTIAPILGAGIGGGLGEAAQIKIEEDRLLSKEEFLKAFGTEAAFEAGGRAFVRGGKFAFSPFIKQSVPEAAAVIQEYSKAGGVLTPVQMDRRFSLSVAEEIAKGGFGGKQVFQDLAEKSGRTAVIYSDTLLDRMAGGVARLGPEQLGREFAEGITRPNGQVFRMLDDLFDPLYTQIDTLSRGATVPTNDIVQFAKRQVATDDRLKGLFLSPTGRSKFQSAASLPDTLSFSDMRKLRSSFMRDTRKLARDVDQSEGLIKQLSKITNDVVRSPKAASGLTPEARRLWENTSRLYDTAQRGLKETFPEQLAKRLVKNPSSVTKELFPQNNPTAIRNLRKALVEPISGRPSAEGQAFWIQLRTSWFADAVEGATRGDVVKPNIFESALRRMGKPAINEMIPDAVGKKQLQTIRNLLKAMSRKPEGGASLFIRGGQVGGLFMLYNGTKEGDFLQVGAGGALVAGPRFFAKMAAHPLGSRLMASGIKLKPGATSLVPITARLINLARKIDRDAIRTEQRKIDIGQATRRVREAQKAIPRGQQFRLRGLGVQ